MHLQESHPCWRFFGICPMHILWITGSECNLLMRHTTRPFHYHREKTGACLGEKKEKKKKKTLHIHSGKIYFTEFFFVCLYLLYPFSFLKFFFFLFLTFPFTLGSS